MWKFWGAEYWIFSTSSNACDQIAEWKAGRKAESVDLWSIVCWGLAISVAQILRWSWWMPRFNSIILSSFFPSVSQLLRQLSRRWMADGLAVELSKPSRTTRRSLKPMISPAEPTWARSSSWFDEVQHWCTLFPSVYDSFLSFRAFRYTVPIAADLKYPSLLAWKNLVTYSFSSAIQIFFSLGASIEAIDLWWLEAVAVY